MLQFLSVFIPFFFRYVRQYFIVACCMLLGSFFCSRFSLTSFLISSIVCFGSRAEICPRSSFSVFMLSPFRFFYNGKKVNFFLVKMLTFSF